LHEADTECVAFLDDDARPQPGWLDAIRMGFEDERVLCVSGRVLADELNTEAQRLMESFKSYDRGTHNVLFKKGHRALFFPVCAWVMGTGSNIACRREAGLALEFDTALGLGTPTRGGGDLDFLYKVIRSGGVVAYRADAVVRHIHRRTQKELRQLCYDYGVATSAFAWKCIVKYHDLSGVACIIHKMTYHVAEIATAALGLRQWPAKLAWTELKGMINGPLAFAKARWETRK
jgi:hypothetical protein